MADAPVSIPSPKSDSSMTLISANQFDKYFDFQKHVRDSLEHVKSYHHFVLTDVRPEWAEILFGKIGEAFSSRKTYNSLSRTLHIKHMPTQIHDCVNAWLIHQLFEWRDSNVMTRQERLLLRTQVGTTLDLTPGPYSGSRKEPDTLIRVQGRKLPTVVAETGWTESMHDLHEDMNLLLIGGNGDINIAIIVKWTEHRAQRRVSGVAELYRRDPQGMPILEQSETIFPRPNVGPQSLSIRRRDLFGPALIPGRNGNDVLRLDIQQLRVLAIEALNFMNLLPA